MVILKSMIRTLLKEEKDFVKLVARANAFIKERLPRGTFFSGMFGFLALDKGSIYFINCGIPAMFFRSPGLDSRITSYNVCYTKLLRLRIWASTAASS